MKFIPHGYQQECIDFLGGVEKAGLFLDLGLGKTSVVLQTIHDNMFSRFCSTCTLVVAPKNVATVAWPNELRKWDAFRDLTFTVLHGPDKRDNLMLKRDIYIINYDGLKWLALQYLRAHRHPGFPVFDSVVIDESTYIKNEGSQRSRLIARMFENVKRKIILTGTPAPNGLIDVYGQMQVIAPGALARTLTSYRDSYFIAPNRESPNRKWTPRKGVSKIIAKKMAPYVRVLKEEDCLERDRATPNTILCELGEKERMEYDTLEQEFFVQLDSERAIEVFNASSLAMKLRQYVQGFVYQEGEAPYRVNSVKIEALKELLEGLNGKPLLCAIQFQYEVDMIREALKYKVPALYSKTSTKDTIEHLSAWNRGEYPLLLGHPASGGVGLNLQDGGSTMCWFSQTWDLLHYDQFNGRLDRQGQPNPVIIHHLVMKDTVDEMIQAALAGKSRTQQGLLQTIKEYRNAKKASIPRR